MRARLAVTVAAALPALGPATAAQPWPETPLARVEALAVLQDLNADLLSHDSATLTLDRWCAAHRLAAPAMNQALDTSDIAFGRAVQALHFSRHTLSAQLLWSSLPVGWEIDELPAPGAGAMVIPDHVLEHRALLSLPDGSPISLVVEDYTAAVLALPPPR